SDFRKIEYWRGKDYDDKVKGLYGGAPKDWKPAPKEIIDQLLPEDYLTCLAEDDQGVIWIGTRQSGFKIADPKTGKQAFGDLKRMGLPDNFITKILMFSEGDYWVGFYGGGIVKPIKPYKLVDRKPLKTRFNKSEIFSVAQNNFPKLPSLIKPPTAETLRKIFYELKIVKSVNTKIIALNDDWRTRGDYIDRYGRHSAVLCAMAGGGFNFYSGYHLIEAEFIGWIGRNYKEKRDSLRNWVHWLESNDTRVLQCLDLGGRRQSEWDDHKEAYPITLDGPHIYVTCKIPKGKYLMSLYFFNKDGHNGANRYRDYLVTVKTMMLPSDLFQKLDKNGENAEEIFLKSKNGAQNRVNEFWGGVWKRFYVEVGNNEFVTLKVDANYSFNTIISAVMFDYVGELKSMNPSVPLEPRKQTQWATVLNNPTNEYWWWTINVMDTLLYRRDNNPVRFYGYSRKDILTSVRSTIRLYNGVPNDPPELDAKDKELIRSDVGKILRATALHKYADMVDFTEEKYEYYRWLDRNRLGRKDARTSDWDWKKFRIFSKENINKQTW
ncbi:MAG: hypothetical protein LBE12_11440, partial [Planctomycetaceae bacterium]|nr:hypothetical protein [Planctomycetaceae bacterium]